MPALDLTEPADLFAKLEDECQALLADHGNSYAAINALRDAFHLAEWIWASRLKGQQQLQIAVMGKHGDKTAWEKYLNGACPRFKLIHELCNGSKHFRPAELIKASHRSAWDSKAFTWDNFTWDDNGHYVETASDMVSVVGLVTGARDFWQELFTRFPQLR